MKIEGYTILETIKETGNSITYLAKKNHENNSVIVTRLQTLQSTPAERARFKHEYDILRNKSINGLIETIDIVEDIDGIILVQEYFDAVPLKKAAKREIEWFLNIAILLCGIVGDLHKNNIIHQNINPNTILLNPETGELKLTGFAVFSEITHEPGRLYDKDVIMNVLPYISPEQSGRMNRSIDYRTDIYSLGVTFYEMLTGRAPFVSNDPLEIIHSHIAQKPLLPEKINLDIPKIVSHIILKLLSKEPEERYQGAFGVMYDLQECRKHLHADNRIVEFSLAQKDVPAKFIMPQKLFGREKEIDSLLSAFDRVRRGNREIIFIPGAPGIGKSALIREVQKQMMTQKGYFVNGKYEQYEHNAPYTAIIQAFRDLVRQILLESKESIETWKREILSVLGENGRIITDVIPDVELLIGEQGDVPLLSTEESNNRFNFVFMNFMRLFARKEHVLVFFLDDLQWADRASLKLLENILSDADMLYFFFIGAYRDNEVAEEHPLLVSINSLCDKGLPMDEIELSPLTIDDITDLVSESLRLHRETIYPLAGEVLRKTGGNPLFVSQFISAVYTGQLSGMDDPGAAALDFEKIKELDFVDSVINLMVDKISKMADETREVLKICACTGNRFDLELLSEVDNRPMLEILGYLDPAVEEGLLVLLEDVYKFSHDKIQEAIYTQIPEDEKKKIHLTIGRTVLQQTSGGSRPDKIFFIVDNLNIARDLLGTENEKNELAKLNLTAALQAKLSTAYKSSLNYITQSITLFSSNLWQSDYDLMFNAHVECSIMNFICGNTEEGEKYFSIVLTRAKTSFDKIKAYNIKMFNITTTSDFFELLELGKRVLLLLGFRIPSRFEKLFILKELLFTKFYLRNKQVEDLINLPELTNREKQEALETMFNCVRLSYIALPKSMPVFLVKSLNLVLQYGNSPYAAIIYASWGFFLCDKLENIERGHKFGKLAVEVLKRTNAGEFSAKVNFLFYSFINHWKVYLKDNIENHLIAYHAGINIGDLTYVGYSLLNHAMNLILAGTPLQRVEETMVENYKVIIRINQYDSIPHYELWLQFVINLRENTGSRTQIKGEIIDENEIVTVFNSLGHVSGLIMLYIIKIFHHVLFNLYGDAATISMEAEQYIEAAMGMVMVPFFYYYSSLAMLADYSNAAPASQKYYLKKVNIYLKKIKVWAHHAPMNNRYKCYLIEAELFRIKGNDVRAMEFYQKAIKETQEIEFIQEEAIAHEFSAMFYREKGFDDIVQMNISRAYDCYVEWGARSKVAQLEETCPSLVSGAVERAHPDDASVSGTDTSLELLDLSTVMKASETISGEMRVEKLLKKIITLSITNAGAEKGCLVLETNGRLYVEAEGQIHDEHAAVLQSIPVENHRGLPQAIISYAARTKETLLLNDAVHEGEFIGDPYVIKNRPRSILCMPIINQGILMGVQYLENNLTSGAFSKERVKILELLSSQAAISINNARLVLVEKEKLELEKKHAEAELKLLQERMSPHFLYNALNSIYSMNYRDSEKANEVLLKLADIYRYMLDQSDKPRIAFDDEWEFTGNYLELEKLQYVDTLLIQLEKKGDFSEVTIPPLTIQPLVENSMKHGLMHVRDDEYVNVFAQKEGNRVVVEVIDNGKGIDGDVNRSRSLGNIVKRLRFYFDDVDLEARNNENGGARIILTFSIRDA
ncbi:MAG: AAA family ATPase [bacterium]|nr:AAA family ATPase [bacterium]